MSNFKQEFISLVRKGSESDDDCLKKKISKQEMVDFFHGKFPDRKSSDLQMIVEKMYGVYDTNGDGLSFEEYCLTRYGSDKGAFVRDLVLKCNKDNNDVIDMTELKAIVEEVQKEVKKDKTFSTELLVTHWLGKFDTDKDDKLSVDECIKGLLDVMIMSMQDGKFNAQQCAE